MKTRPASPSERSLRKWPDAVLVDPSKGCESEWTSEWTLKIARYDKSKRVEDFNEYLSSYLTETTQFVTKSNQDFFRVTLSLQCDELKVRTFTSSHTIGSEFMLSFRRLFNAIDQRIGKVLAIQDQAPVLWMNRGNDLNDVNQQGLQD